MRRHVIADVDQRGSIDQREVHRDDDDGPMVRLRFDAGRPRAEIERAIARVLDRHYGKPEPRRKAKAPGRLASVPTVRRTIRNRRGGRR